MISSDWKEDYRVRMHVIIDKSDPAWSLDYLTVELASSSFNKSVMLYVSTKLVRHLWGSLYSDALDKPVVCLRRGFCSSRGGLQELYADLRIYISPFDVVASPEVFRNGSDGLERFLPAWRCC